MSELLLRQRKGSRRIWVSCAKPVGDGAERPAALVGGVAEPGVSSTDAPVAVLAGAMDPGSASAAAVEQLPRSWPREEAARIRAAREDAVANARQLAADRKQWHWEGVPAILQSCLICGKAKHVGKRESRALRVPIGGRCYVCAKSCALIGVSRSLGLLEAAQLRGVVKAFSAEYTRRMTDEPCQCKG